MRTFCLAILLAVLACGDDDAHPVNHDAASASDGSSVVACASLEQAACKARVDCAADLCFDCACVASFAGCRDADDVANSCPDTACEVECCQSENTCSNAALCLAPGESASCGICFDGESSCVTDNDCKTENTICEPMPCACSGQTACLPGCEETGCDQGFTCDPDTSRCAPADCPCPGEFECNADQCERRSCENDKQCPAGVCVKGFCYDRLGTCMLPVP